MYGNIQNSVMMSLSFTGTNLTIFPSFSRGNGTGLPKSGKMTLLFSTAENLLITHSSICPISCRPEIASVMILEEYHLL